MLYNSWPTWKPALHAGSGSGHAWAKTRQRESRGCWSRRAPVAPVMWTRSAAGQVDQVELAHLHALHHRLAAQLLPAAPGMRPMPARPGTDVHPSVEARFMPGPAHTLRLRSKKYAATAA